MTKLQFKYTPYVFPSEKSVIYEQSNSSFSKMLLTFLRKDAKKVKKQMEIKQMHFSLKLKKEKTKLFIV